MSVLYKKIIYVIIGIILNAIGYYVVAFFKIPLFLDSIGTIFAAVFCGPIIGLLTGVLTNLSIGIFDNNLYIPFAIINGIIGFIYGYVAFKYNFKKIYIPLITSIIVSILVSILVTPLISYLYGGATGGPHDKILFALAETGKTLFTSTFLSRISSNFYDKLISTIFVYIFYILIPYKYKIGNKGVSSF